MKVGDLVNITETRGTGTYPQGSGLVLEIEKTSDLTFGSIGPVNLGNVVTVQVCSSGEVLDYIERSLEVINESR